jgi:tetratricopeptide (TPR) repeat protein
VVGEPIPVHLSYLKSARWLQSDELVLRSSRDDDDPAAAGIFYAQSWALVHMMCLAEDYREKTLRFVERIAGGEPVGRAFQAAYEKSLDQALSDLRGYLDRPLRKIAVASPNIESLEISETKAVTEVETLTWRAELLLLMGKHSAASRMYREALSKYPNAPESHTGIAVLALRARRFDVARAEFEKAIALGSNDADNFFEYAMLLRDTNAPPERVNEYLLKAVGLNPDHAEAHFLLAVRASDAGDYNEAVNRLLRATMILPRQSSFWQALAFAYHKLGRSDDSRTAARKALNAATSEREEVMARAALKLGDEKPLPGLAKPPVHTPSSWKGLQGDARIEGQLVAVDCGEFARLKVKSSQGEKTLVVKRPNSVALRGKGSPRLEFSCGPQKAMPVIVEYIAATSEITAIEFR